MSPFRERQGDGIRRKPAAAGLVEPVQAESGDVHDLARPGERHVGGGASATPGPHIIPAPPAEATVTPSSPGAGPMIGRWSGVKSMVAVHTRRSPSPAVTGTRSASLARIFARQPSSTARFSPGSQVEHHRHTRRSEIWVPLGDRNLMPRAAGRDPHSGQPADRRQLRPAGQHYPLVAIRPALVSTPRTAPCHQAAELDTLGHLDSGADHRDRVGGLMVAARCLGAAQRLIEEMTGFAARRHAGGRAIAEHGLVAGMLADSLTELFAARALTYETARGIDAQADTKVSHAQCSMAKLYCSEMAGRVADRAVQVFGGAATCARTSPNASSANCASSASGKAPAKSSA